MEAMKAGLGAISPGVGTPGASPRRPEAEMGMPRQSMEQMVEVARKMSDGQLADILAGRSMEVPQFVAMSEAMGRRQLRTAMQGAQAQRQGQQPSLRERFLAESQPQQPQQPAPRPQARMSQEAGIDALPAPNMEQMDSMASGGIVAFADGDLVQSPYSDELERQAAEDRGLLMRGLRTVGAEVGDRLMLPVQAVGSAGALLNRGLRALGVPSSVAPMIPTDYTLEGASLGFGGGPMATALEEQRAAQEAQNQRQAADTAAMANLGLTPEGEMAPPETPAPDMDALGEAVSRGAGAATAGAGGAGMGGAGVGGAEMAQMPARSRFEQFMGQDEALQQTLEDQQRQSEGEFLMQIGASLLTSPTIAQGIGEGAQKALPGLAANRQAAAKLQRDAREFQFSVAKAEEAAELGQQELALRYEQLAADKAYNAGRLAVSGGKSGLTQKDMAKMYMDFRENKLKPAGAAMRYDGMSDAEKQEWEQQTRAEFAQMMGSLGVGGGGTMGGTIPLSLREAAQAEDQRRKAQQATGE